MSSVSATVGLTQQDFLKVLVAQYSNQIPTDAADSTAFYKNLMDLSNYQAIQSNTTQMSEISAQQTVGKTVTATDDNGDTVSGTVSSARYDGTDWYFTIGGTEVKAANINGFTSTSTTATGTASSSSN